MDWKEENGAIVVEATISLSVFMFAIVTILTIINICLVQARIGVAINLAAKDISQYTYIYALTGLNEKQKELASNSNKAVITVDDALGEMDNMFDAVRGISTLFQEGMHDEELRSSMKSLVLNEIAEGVKSQAAGLAVKALVKDRLSTQEKDCDSFLKRMGIQEGLDGIRFSDSVVCLNGTDEIKIIAKYKVHVIRLLGNDIDIQFMQCAATKAWFPYKAE